MQHNESSFVSKLFHFNALVFACECRGAVVRCEILIFIKIVNETKCQLFYHHSDYNQSEGKWRDSKLITMSRGGGSKCLKSLWISLSLSGNTKASFLMNNLLCFCVNTTQLIPSDDQFRSSTILLLIFLLYIKRMLMGWWFSRESSQSVSLWFCKHLLFVSMLICCELKQLCFQSTFKAFFCLWIKFWSHFRILMLLSHSFMKQHKQKSEWRGSEESGKLLRRIFNFSIQFHFLSARFPLPSWKPKVGSGNIWTV